MRTIEALESLSKNLLVDHGLFSTPIDISKLIRKLGFIRVEKDFTEDFLGAAFIEGDQKIIAINRKQGMNRKRFTLAHECAHLILHSDSPVNFDREFSSTFFRDDHSIKNPDWREVEANRFAAMLLMPKDLLEKEVKSIIHTSGDFSQDHIVELASLFKVSSMAMSIRLKSLDFI